MSHFIIKKSNDPNQVKKTENFNTLNELKPQYMNAKCGKTKNDFVIRLEKENNVWYMVYAFKENNTRNANSVDSFKNTSDIDISKGLLSGQQYRCPDCGATSITKCGVGTCKKITCWGGEKITSCAYCGNTGQVGGSMNSVTTATRKQENKK